MAVFLLVATHIPINNGVENGKRLPIAEVTADKLADLVEDSEYLAVLFYDPAKLGNVNQVIHQLEQVTLEGKYETPIVKIGDEDEFHLYGIKTRHELPVLLLFDDGVPERYMGQSFNHKDVEQWITDEVKSDDIDVVELDVLWNVAKLSEAVLAIFYDEDNFVLPSEEDEIQHFCEQYDIALAKVEGRAQAASFGFKKLPAISYFENGVPSIYEDSMQDMETLLEWIEEQRTSATIETVSEQILIRLVNETEYLAVFFTGPCNEKALTNNECETVLAELENIDDELDEFGIPLVTTQGIKYAGTQLGIRKIPALGLFRNGNFLLHEGPLDNERDLLSWLIDEETIELPGQIEIVGPQMLKRLIREEDHVAVLFYDGKSDNRKTANILQGLETIDDDLDGDGIELVKCTNTKMLGSTFGLFNSLPALILFDHQVPIVFPKDGDLLDESEVLIWIREMKENEEIPLIELPALEKLAVNVEHLVVVFHDPNKQKQQQFIEDMENVDEAAASLEMMMVKVDVIEAGKRYGIDVSPAVVYFENNVPSLYDDDFHPETLLHWLQEQLIEARIKKITLKMLDDLVKQEEYIAVLFLSNHDTPDHCQELENDLDTIDEELEKLGIIFVQIEDQSYPQKIKAPEDEHLVVFYRNGQKILFEGNVEYEMAVLKFLTDLNHILLPDQIEEVGLALMEHMTEEREHVFVFLYTKGDGRAMKILKKLTAINDNLENDGVLLIKSSEDGIAEEYGLGYTPRLVYFERKIPEPYVGDLMNEGQILKWISDELKRDEIKSVTRNILEGLLDKFDHIGVLFVDDEDKEEVKIIQELEKYHDEFTDAGLTLVQVDDPDFEQEMGLTDLPTLVHFKENIPCLYYGEESKESIFEWMTFMAEENVIENVTTEILAKLKEDEEYLGIFFSGPCDTEECQEVLQNLEEIDDDLEAIGISFVRTQNTEYAESTLEIEKFPALGLYRNGAFLKYKGSLSESEPIKRWFVSHGNLKVKNQIEKVNTKMLKYFYETDNKLVVLFYDEKARDSDEIIQVMETIDHKLDKLGISMVRSSDPGTELQYGITELPALVYIKSGIPGKFRGDLMNASEAFLWIKTEANTTRMHEVNDIVLTKLVEKFDHIAAVFYDMEEDPTVENLQKIAPDCQENEIAIVMIKDEEEAGRLGLENLPKLVFYHSEIPSVMTANIDNPDETFDFLQRHKSASFIEEVTDNMLEELIDRHQFVAVFFRGDGCPTESDSDEDDGNDLTQSSKQSKVNCDQILAEMETIDDDLDDIGIIIVTTAGFEVAKDNGVQEFPALGLFRNGHFILFEGDQENEKQILKWLTDEDTLKIIGVIDEVNMPMLENILVEQNDAFVFFYNNLDAEAHVILEELEQIDEKLDKQDLTMVKIADPEAKNTYGIEAFPSLVYFEEGVPVVYEGDLFNDNTVMKWMKAILKQEEIKNVTTLVLRKLIERDRTMAVLFFDEEGETDAKVLEELEKIDDDCSRFGISFVKVADKEEANYYGIEDRPGLLYFENKIPSIYDGDLLNEDSLLEWLIEQKTTDTVEEVTDTILEKLVLEEEFIAVFFSGPCERDDPCATILQELETIDTIITDLGIMLVTTEDRSFARQQSVRGFPALGLFKNGDFVAYEGDLFDEMMILSWISDKETLEISDKIPEINQKMLEHLITTETHVIAFLYKSHSIRDNAVAQKLEKMRENKSFQEKHIDLVKCSDKNVEKAFGLGSLPSLVHFSRGIPLVYEDDIEKEKKVLSWIMHTTELDEIEEVTAPILDVLVENTNSLAVLFFNKSEEDDVAFIKDLEGFDDECDSLSISLVKINDEGKALEFGIETTPAIVYFENGLPSLCPEEFLDKANETFLWLQEQKKFSKIPQVTDVLMERIVQESEYVVVLFLGFCKESSEDCQIRQSATKEALEEITEELSEIGYASVMNIERMAAVQTHNITEFPAIALFKNGIFEKYPGDIQNLHEILRWLSNVETIEILGQIEHVNRAMLKYLVEMEDDLVVFFHEAADKLVDDILDRLKSVDDNLESERVSFVRCSDVSALDDYSLTMKPSIVYFKRGVPLVYIGDLRNDDSLLGWITQELQSEHIAEVKANILDSLLERVEFAAILYSNGKSEESIKVIETLTPLDEECKMHDIVMAQITDPEIYKTLGVEEPVVLVYYENNIPFLYPGSLSDVKSLKEWLIYQRNMASIEEVTDDMLEEIIQENEFVAVLFLGLCSDDDEGETEEYCDTVVKNLETIDSSLDEFGIVLVMTKEIERAHEQWISKFPAIAYYRNEEFMRYPAEVSNARAVFRWLTSIKTMDLADKIIDVNALTLDKLIERESSNLFVLFYEERDILADRILRKLEDIDDDLPNSNFLKTNDVEEIAAEYNIEQLPMLAHFKNGIQTVFYGDLKEMDAVNAWLQECVSVKKGSAAEVA